MLTIAPLPTQGYELDESLHGLTMMTTSLVIHFVLLLLQALMGTLYRIQRSLLLRLFGRHGLIL